MIYGDSNLVVQQTMKECNAVQDNMVAYRNIYNILEGTFDGCETQHIARASNEEVDALTNIGSKGEPIPPGVFYEEIDQRSIKPKKKTVESPSTTPAPVDSSAIATSPANNAPEIPPQEGEPEEVMVIE